MLVGNQYETPVLQEGYPRHRRDRTGRWSREYLYHVHIDRVYLYVPSVGSEDPYLYGGLGDDSDMVIDDVEILTLPNTEGNVVGLRLTYAQPEAVQPDQPKEPGVEIFETNTEIHEKPITEHPNFGAIASKDDKDLLQSKYPTFTHGRISLTHTKTFERARYKLTEARIKQGINDLNQPPGVNDASENKWMKVRRSVRLERGTVEEVDEYHFDQSGWEGNIRYDSNLDDIIANLK